MLDSVRKQFQKLGKLLERNSTIRTRLDLRHLDMLEAIADCRTLADAAEQLHISPSALTHRLREAERRLGVPLFQRQGRRMRPTAAAQILTQTARRVKQELGQAERLAVVSSTNITEIVRLSVAVYNVFHWLPAFLSWFREVEPGIQIEIETQGTAAPYGNLFDHTIDILMTPETAIPRSFEAVELFRDELVAVVPADHPYADRDYLTGADFLFETYLTYSLVKQPGFEADRVWAAEDVLPLKEDKIGSIEAICELIKAGFGLSILSKWALQPHFDTGSLVPIRTTEEGLDLSWNALVRGGIEQDSPEKRTADALANWFSQHPQHTESVAIGD